MTGKLPSFFEETIGAMLNLCLTVYNHQKHKSTRFEKTPTWQPKTSSFLFFIPPIFKLYYA